MTTLRDLLHDMIVETVEYTAKNYTATPKDNFNDFVQTGELKDFIDDKLDEYIGYIVERWIG